VSSPRGSIGATNLALLAVGLLAVSASGPMMAAATMVPAIAMSWWRTALGTVLIAPVALTRHRDNVLGMPRREVVRSAFAGLMLAGHFATWVTALHYTSVASATALLCFQVGWVVLIARMSGHRITRDIGMGMLLALVGVLLVSGVDFAVSGRAAFGDLLAVAGGVFAALYMTVGSSVRAHVTTTAYTFLCYGSCALILLVGCLVFRIELSGYGAKGWMLIVAVTLVAQLGGHSIFNHLLHSMSPTIVSMALLLEVPGAAILAAVFLGQAPPVAVYVGLVLICGGLALVLRARSGSDVPIEAPLD